MKREAIEKPSGPSKLRRVAGYSLTTLKPGDGAYLGPCKVIVTPFIPGIDPDKPAPPPPPRPDIPARYRSEAETPLAVEVVAGKKNVFEFSLD